MFLYSTALVFMGTAAGTLLLAVHVKSGRIKAVWEYYLYTALLGLTGVVLWFLSLPLPICP